MATKSYASIDVLNQQREKRITQSNVSESVLYIVRVRMGFKRRGT